MTMTARTIAGLAAASALLAGCSATVDSGGAATQASPAGTVRGTTRYADNGVKFDYPASWTTIEDTTATGSTGSSIWSQGFGPGTSAADVAIVSAYPLKIDVSNVPSQELKGEIDATLDRVAQQAGGRRDGGLTAARLGSLQGFTATIDARSPDGRPVQSQVFLAFDHATEYYLNCQYQPASRTEILAGCERIRSTFAVD
jgi:hypothetical protein